MNKIITFLVVGLYLFVFNPLAKAQTLPTFNISAVNDIPDEGEAFMVDVNVENFQNLLGFQFLITFDESVIQPVTNASGITIAFSDTHANLILVQGSYVAGQGIRVSWNSLTGVPTSVNPPTPFTKLFAIPFTVVGTNDNATLLDVDCVNFNCEVIGQNGTTGMSEVISPEIMLGGDELVIDVGGTGSTVDPPNPPSEGPVTIIATNPGGITGSTLCMDISVSDFTDIAAMQYTMHWDENLFQYSSVNTANSPLTSLTSGNFGTTFANEGTLTFSWNNAVGGGSGIDLTDGTSIYEVCFVVLGSGGDVSDFTFDGNPTPIEVTDGNNVKSDEINFTNGSLTVTEGSGVNSINLTTGSTSGDAGDTLCIPVFVDSFDDIIGFQYSISYDPSVLTYINTQNHASGLLAFSDAFFNESPSGSINVSWNHPANTPVTLDDGTLLYEICFDITGTPGEESTIEITDSPTSIEITYSTGPGTQSPNGILTSNTPTFTVSNEGGFNLNICNENLTDPADPNRVCIPITATGFNNMVGIQWTIQYDNSVLSFDTSDPSRIQNVHLDLLALLVSSFNEVSPGLIAFSWSHPALIPANPTTGETLFEMCFAVTGDLANVQPIAIVNAPTIVEITALADPSDPLSAAPVANVGIDNTGCATAADPIVIDTDASTITNSTCGGDGAIDVVFSGGTAPFTFAWSTGDDTQNVSGLDAGDYTITITDSANSTASQTFTVDGSPALSATATATNESANQAGDGTTNLTVTGGTPDYTYLWTNTQTTQNLENLSPNNYMVTVTDANGCTTTASAVVGTALTIGAASPPGGPNGASIVTDITCNGDNDGAINLVFSGGVSPYTFNWNTTPATNEDLTGLGAGNYCVTVSDFYLNTATACFDIIEPDPITITLDNIDHETVAGLADGNINVTVAGGTPLDGGGYNYNWIPVGSTATEDLTDRGPGNYMLIVVDANMCSSTSDSYTIDAGTDGIAITLNETTTIDCFGECTASIEANVVGGQAPLTFEWSETSFGSSQNINNVCAGSYSVTVTDATSTVAISSIDIAQPAAALTATASITHESSSGASDGAIDLIPSGGTTAYSFAWSDGDTNEDRTGLSPGVYTVTITDANACDIVQSYTVQASSVMINETGTVIADVVCFGDCTGAINLALNGGTAPLSFAWSPNTSDNTQNVSGLCAGAYSVTVTDGSGTSDTATFTVGQPATALNITGVTTAETNGNDGSIDITVTGGSGNLNYLWSNGSTNQDLFNIGAGSYTVTVTDSNECTDSATFTVGSSLEIDSNASSITDATCFGGNDGAIDVVVNGGVAPLTYSWSSGDTTEDITDKTAGTYTIIVTDAQNNSVTQAFTIGQAPQIQILCLATPESTNGGDGSITVNPSNGVSPYTYQWTNSAGVPINSSINMIQNLVAGTYTVMATDANGCTEIESCTVVTNFGVSQSIITDVDCFGENTGAINITTVGGSAPYTWSWQNPLFSSSNEDITGLAAGVYNLTITDAVGEQFTASYTIGQPGAPLEITNVVIVDEIAPNLGSINITVAGGTPPYAYFWSNGATSEDLSNLQAGCYNVVITDANDCVLSSPDYCVEYVPVDLSVQIMNITQPTCNGANDGAITITINGGDPAYSVAWNNNSPAFNSDAPITYTINNLGTETVVITVMDGNGQIIVLDPIEIVEPAAIAADFAIGSITDCPGNGFIESNVSGGIAPLMYSWETPNGSVSTENLGNLSMPGEYYLTVTDANGCIQAFPPVTVNMDTPQLVLNTGASSTMNVPCPQDETGSIDLEVSGGFCTYSFLWSNAEETEDISGLVAGSYTVTVTDEAGQMATETFVIETDSDLVISGIFTTSDYPNGFPVSAQGACDATASIVVSSGNGITITWCNGQIGPNANGLCPGPCEVMVEDALNCTSTIVIDIPDAPDDPTLPPTTNPIVENACGDDCNGAININVSNGTAPFTYAWSPNLGNFEYVDGLCAGTYAYTVTDSDGRSVTGSEIVEATGLTLTFTTTEPSSLTSFDGSATVAVSGGSGDYVYQWNDAGMTTIARAENLKVGTYFVVVIDQSSGCETTGSVVLGAEGDCLSARNIITPNEDGCNDEFTIFCLNQCESNTLEIYNRWGQLVMEYEDYSNDWIGQNRRGFDLPAGAYFYVFTCEAGGTSEQRKGHITVLREE